MAAIPPTAGDQVRRALRLTGQYPLGESIPGEVINEALDVLNYIIRDWGGEPASIPYQTYLSFPLVAGQNVYTNGVGAQYDINSNQIIDILRANYVLGDLVMWLNIIDEYQYNSTWDRNLTGIPDSVLLRLHPTTSDIIFSYLPQQAFTINLVVKQRLSTLTLSDTINEIPENYFSALVYTTAKELAAYWDIELPPAVAQEQERLYNDLINANCPSLDVTENRSLSTANSIGYYRMRGV